MQRGNQPLHALPSALLRSSLDCLGGRDAIALQGSSFRLRFWPVISAAVPVTSAAVPLR